jgi:hypothetical protein
MMRKRDELTNPNGCMYRAKDNEMTFVLLGRDVAAPTAILAWCAERIRLGKNVPGDPQLVEAVECATTMERERVAGIPDADLAKPLLDELAELRSAKKKGEYDLASAFAQIQVVREKCGISQFSSRPWFLFVNDMANELAELRAIPQLRNNIFAVVFKEDETLGYEVVEGGLISIALKEDGTDEWCGEIRDGEGREYSVGQEDCFSSRAAAEAALAAGDSTTKEKA